MSICGKITKNQKLNCATPLIGGVRDKVRVFNFDDIDTITRDATNPQVIRAITLKAAAKGFYWEGPPNSVTAVSRLVRKRYRPTYEQLVGLPLMENSSELKQELEKAGWGRFLVIVENNYRGGDAIFEVYFTERGGILVANESDKNNDETDGAYAVQFGQLENSREGTLPATFAVLDGETPVYDYAATVAAIDLLITADV